MQMALWQEGFKRCSACRELVPLSGFNRRSGSRDGFQSYCRACNSRWHADHREHHNRQIAARNVRVKEEMRRRMAEYLRSKACADCGEADLRVLEFDHLRDKTIEVSVLVARGHSWERILEEIAKCEVVCANCHRRRTHDRANTYRSRMRQAPRTLDDATGA